MGEADTSHDAVLRIGRVEFEGLGYRRLGLWEELPWQTIASAREITVRPS